MTVKTSKRRRVAQSSADQRNPPAGHGAIVAAVREQAIVALLSAPTIVAAAARVGIGESTLPGWLTDDPEFQTAFAAARHATFAAACARLPTLAITAVSTLADLLDDKHPPAVRLGAARTVAELGQYQDDAETIMRKLDALEARQPRR